MAARRCSPTSEERGAFECPPGISAFGRVMSSPAASIWGATDASELLDHPALMIAFPSSREREARSNLCCTEQTGSRGQPSSTVLARIERTVRRSVWPRRRRNPADSLADGRPEVLKAAWMGAEGYGTGRNAKGAGELWDCDSPTRWLPWSRKGTEMQDLSEAYKTGVEPLLSGLRSALPGVRSGDREAVAAARRCSHQLKGSGTSYGHPEITSLAAAALNAPDADLPPALETLMSALAGILSEDQRRQRILIVDDDPLIRLILAKTLESRGREFVTAESLADARVTIDGSIDLVLLDLMLQDGDGRQLLRFVQANPETARIPIIVLSGSGSNPIRQSAMDAGADAFVEKPFDPSVLSDAVDDLLAGVHDQVVVPAGGTLDDEHADTITVLIAEDDDLVAALVSDRLTRDGYEIRRAADGESALTDALSSPPHLTILDVMMPKMNGFEVLGRLRSAPQTADMPVIILTGRGREEDVVRGFDLGATDYIVKPFSPAELAVRVRRHTSAP